MRLLSEIKVPGIYEIKTQLNGTLMQVTVNESLHVTHIDSMKILPAHVSKTKAEIVEKQLELL